MVKKITVFLIAFTGMIFILIHGIKHLYFRSDNQILSEQLAYKNTFKEMKGETEQPSKDIEKSHNDSAKPGDQSKKEKTVKKKAEKKSPKVNKTQIVDI